MNRIRELEKFVIADDPSDDVLQDAFAEQVQKELDALPEDIAHLVAQQVRPPYHSGSVEQVRTLARRFRGSMG